MDDVVRRESAGSGTPVFDRRQLLSGVGACLLGGLHLSSLRAQTAAATTERPPGVTEPRSAKEAYDLGLACHRRNEFAQAEWYARAIFRFDGVDANTRKAGSLLLGFALSEQWKTEEALAVAKARWEVFQDAPGVSLYASTAYRNLDMDLARQVVKYYYANYNKWNDHRAWSAEIGVNGIRDRISRTTYRIVFDIDVLPNSGPFIFFTPQTMPYQVVEASSVVGAEQSEKRVDPFFHDEYYMITPKKEGGNVRVSVQLTQTPRVYDVSTVDGVPEAPLSPDMLTYLGPTRGHGVLWIDPEGDRARAIVEENDLKGRTRTESARNVLLWAKRSMRRNAQRQPGMGTSEKALTELAGQCEETSMGFVALLRRCGVPARLVRGINFLGPAFDSRRHIWPLPWIMNPLPEPLRCPQPPLQTPKYVGTRLADWYLTWSVVHA